MTFCGTKPTAGHKCLDPMTENYSSMATIPAPLSLFFPPKLLSTVPAIGLYAILKPYFLLRASLGPLKVLDSPKMAESHRD
jgi:hypothetical protein